MNQPNNKTTIYTNDQLLIKKLEDEVIYLKSSLNLLVKAYNSIESRTSQLENRTQPEGKLVRMQVLK